MGGEFLERELFAEEGRGRVLAAAQAPGEPATTELCGNYFGGGAFWSSGMGALGEGERVVCFTVRQPHMECADHSTVGGQLRELQTGAYD